MVPPLFDVECHICSLIYACFMLDLGLHEGNPWVVIDGPSACRECLWSDGARVKKKTTCDTTDLWAILSCCWSVSQPQKRANFQCTKSWRLIVFKINEVSTAGAVCTFTVFTIFDFSTLLLFPGNLCCHTPPYHLSTNQHSHPVTCIWDFAVASLWWMKTSVCTLSKRKPERRLAHFWDNKLCFCYLLASDLYFEMFLKLRNSQVEAIYWGMICLSEHKQ